MEKEGGRLGLRWVGSRVRSVDGDWNGRGRRRFVRVVGGERTWLRPDAEYLDTQSKQQLETPIPSSTHRNDVPPNHLYWLLINGSALYCRVRSQSSSGSSVKIRCAPNFYYTEHLHFKPDHFQIK